MITALATPHLMKTYQPWPVTFVRARGSTLHDDRGREYLDLVAGIAVASVGHAHPDVVSAIYHQADRLLHVSNLYGSEPQVRLAARLGELSGGMRAFFCNSGAEAIECALKLARRWGGPDRTRVVATLGGFHGRTLGALSATGQPTKAVPFEPLVPGFTHVPFGDLDALAEALGQDVAAVVLEPIQGEAGVIVPRRGYLKGARSLCDDAGALLVLDEVQTGLGRTGTFFAFETEGIVPDVLCLAKALAGGLPMGACLAVPQVAEAFQIGDHGSTFGGGPVQSAAALAVLDVIENEGLLDRALEGGSRLSSGLARIFEPASVRGRGLMLGVGLPSECAHQFVQAALAMGLLVNAPTADVLRFTPPLVITDPEIDRALDILEEVWDEVGPA